MMTKETRHMTHQEIAKHLGVSTKTIDRRREAGKLQATKINGKWIYEIEVEADVDTDEPSVETPVLPMSSTQVNQMQSEIDYLRHKLDGRDDELARKDQLLALALQNNKDLTLQLSAPPDPLFVRVKRWFSNTPSEQRP